MKTIRTRTLITVLGTLFYWLLPSNCWASVEVDGIYYDLDSSAFTATVTSNSNEYSGDIVIPSSIDFEGNSYSVTTIDRSVFTDCTGLTSVTIPNSVTNICPEAFLGCTGLTSIIIPNSVTEIGSSVFYGCSGLTSVSIPNSVTSIGFEAFRNTGLTSIEIPNSVTSIGGGAFFCSSLTNMTIPSSVTSIGGCAFYGTNLTSVTIPYSVTTIGGDAFYNTPWYDNQPDGLIYINQVAYEYKGKMPEETSISIRNGTVSISENAFLRCTGLTSVTIPNSVTNIGSSAFSGCSGLISVTIPNSVTSIGSSVFSGCNGLTSITCESEIPVALPNSNVFYNIDKSTCTLYVPTGSKSAYENADGWSEFENIVEYTPAPEILATGSCGDNVIYTIYSDNSMVISGTGAMKDYYTYGNHIFNNYHLIEKVIVEEGVTTIGNYAFRQFGRLTSVDIPNSVTSIGKGAFDSCTGLTSVNIKDLSAWCQISFTDSDSNPVSYSHSLYLNGEKIENLLLPAGLTSIGNYAFYNCTDLSSVEIQNSVTSIGHFAFFNCSSLPSVDIPNSVTSIGDYAFQSCTGLTSVTIGDNLTSIGNSAFYDCTSLTSVDIPNSVTSIGQYAFYGCKVLSSMEFPNNLTSIGKYAFYHCVRLTSVVIPKGVTIINEGVFCGCTGLSSVTLLNGVTTIGNFVFNGCTSLATITIPSSVTIIGNGAFQYCSLTSVDIPNGVTYIGYDAFLNCTDLTSLTIPNSVASIPYRAFSGCIALTSIKIEKDTPISIDSDTFENVNKSSCTLYVPVGSKSAYESAEGWSEFDNIVEYTPAPEVLATGSCGDNVTYTIYSDNSMVISGTGAMTDFTINYDDDTINRENNEYWTQVKTVTIEEGVTSLGDYAFSNCAELTSVSIPNSVNSIGSSVFLGCSALTSITIPASVGTIGENALSYSGLTHIYIEDSDDVLQFEQVTFDMDDYEDPLEYVYLGRNIKTIDFHEYNPWEGVEGYPPFSRSSNLHTLEIGDKVTYLEDWSFNSAPLQSLVIGSNVQSIGTRALSSANVGQTLVIPSNVKRMGDYSLSPSISTLVLEKGSDDLELFAGFNSLELSFYGSESSIDSIYVGRNLTCSSNNIQVECRSACFDASLRRSMNDSGEEDEFDLTEYYIPPVCATNYYFGSGASIGEYYFQNSPVEHVYNLRSSRVGNFAFFNSNVKTVGFDAEGSTTIGNSVFSGCVGLTTLSFPEGMTDIGDNAFMDCYGLTSITIPSSLQSIGGDCFFMEDTERNVSFNVYISDLSAWCSMNIGWGGSPLIWGHLIYNGEEITDLVVPDDVQSIGMGAFDGCSSLTSVVIPESVTSIGERAFYCTGLTSVTMESAVPLTIDGSTFEEVNKTNCILYVPAGSKTAYENAEGWSEFQNIEEYTPAQEVLATGSCGNNVTYTIYSDMTMVVSGTGQMKDYNYDEQINDEYYQSIQEVIIEEGVTSIGECAFKDFTSLTSVIIPSSVRFIDMGSFAGCTGLTSVIIPRGVTSIGEEAFYHCEGLTSISISNSVTIIGPNAFYGCTDLTSVTIPEGVKTIGDYAFSYCTNLTNVVIPYSVTTIGVNAFAGFCLNSISVDERNTKYDSRDNCNAIIETASNTLRIGCKTTVIPNSVTSIGLCAFENCLGLSSITIPNSVTSIDNYAFYFCSDLTSVSIPSNVGSIGNCAFEYCSDLTSITCEGETPVTINSSVFNNVYKSTCTLYVPAGSKTAYENAAYWSEFENIVEYGEEPDTDISALDNAIYVDHVDGRIGGTKVVSVKMKDNFDACAFQFIMRVPEGVTITGWNLSSKRLSTAVSTPVDSGNILEDGRTIKVVYSLSGMTYSGDDGEIATINLSFSEEMEEGSYPIYLLDCHSNGIDCVDVPMSDIKATLSLEDYVVGDANGDGQVLVGDVTALLNYIVGRPISNFKENAADVNGDGVILVGDVTALLNIIVNQVSY